MLFQLYGGFERVCEPVIKIPWVQNDGPELKKGQKHLLGMLTWWQGLLQTRRILPKGVQKQADWLSLQNLRAHIACQEHFAKSVASEVIIGPPQPLGS